MAWTDMGMIGSQAYDPIKEKLNKVWRRHNKLFEKSERIHKRADSLTCKVKLASDLLKSSKVEDLRAQAQRIEAKAKRLFSKGVIKNCGDVRITYSFSRAIVTSGKRVIWDSELHYVK